MCTEHTVEVRVSIVPASNCTMQFNTAKRSSPDKCPSSSSSSCPFPSEGNRALHSLSLSKLLSLALIFSPAPPVVVTVHVAPSYMNCCTSSISLPSTSWIFIPGLTFHFITTVFPKFIFSRPSCLC